MQQQSGDETFQPIAGALAVCVPGAGHLWLGQPRRAIMVFVGVLWLFVGGLLIGGVDVVDRREDFWWFVGQAGVGPTAFAVNAWHQSLKADDPPRHATGEWFDDNTPARTRSLGHPNEIGALWATIAGMLNVIAIIDAAWHAPATRRRRGATT
ncbi:MAG: DUF6677 family protein [Phycisphaerales bacterium]